MPLSKCKATQAGPELVWTPGEWEEGGAEVGVGGSRVKAWLSSLT